MNIGLTYTGSEEKHNNYLRWLIGNDDVQVTKLCLENDNLNEIEQCDRIVLSGGIDIHPKFYNATKLRYDNAPEAFNEKRDAFEINVIEKALKLNKLILGICRGMQLINICFGGTLIQDLGEKNHKHKATGKDKTHDIVIKEHSVLKSIVKTESLVANSAHHQAIGVLGAGLKINCESDDGVPEGLEWANPFSHSFMLCVQWHPERMHGTNLEDSPLSKSIRSSFITNKK